MDTSTGKKCETYNLFELCVKAPVGRVLFSSCYDLGEKPKPKDGSPSDDLKASYSATFYQDRTITCDPSGPPIPGKIRISEADYDAVWKKSLENLRAMVDGDIEFLLDNKDCYPGVYNMILKQAKEELGAAKFENIDERRNCMRRLYKARYSKHFTEEHEYLVNKRNIHARAITGNRQPFRKMSDDQIANKKSFKDAYPEIQKTLDDNKQDDPYLPLARICQQEYAKNMNIGVIPCDYCIGYELVKGVRKKKYQDFHPFDRKLPVDSIAEPTLFINTYNNLANLGQLSALNRVSIYKFEPYAERAMKRSEPSFDYEPEPFPEAPVHPSKRKTTETAADAVVDHGEYLTEDAHDGASSSNKRAKTSTDDYDTYAGSN
jgi:hypothetical protein